MRRLAGTITLILFALGLFAQLEPLTNQYYLNTLSINPAYAGSRDALSIVAMHRNQWTGFEGAPKTVSLAMHAPLRNEKIGLGLLTVNDQRGISSSTVFLGNFAYRIETGGGIMSLGLAGGFTHLKNDWNSLLALDPGDELLRGNQESYFLPDFSLGAYFHSDQFFFGFSIPMFMTHNFDPAKNTFHMDNRYEEYNFFFNGGYLFKPSATIRVLPSVLVRFNRASAPQADLNLHLILFDRFQTGLSFRSNKSLVGLVMYHVNKQLSLAYSYDLGFGKIGGYMGSSHEIMIRYEFRYFRDVVNPRYF